MGPTARWEQFTAVCTTCGPGTNVMPVQRFMDRLAMTVNVIKSERSSSNHSARYEHVLARQPDGVDHEPRIASTARVKMVKLSNNYQYLTAFWYNRIQWKQQYSKCQYDTVTSLSAVYHNIFGISSNLKQINFNLDNCVVTSHSPNKINFLNATIHIFQLLYLELKNM